MSDVVDTGGVLAIIEVVDFGRVIWTPCEVDMRQRSDNVHMQRLQEMFAGARRVGHTVQRVASPEQWGRLLLRKLNGDRNLIVRG